MMPDTFLKTVRFANVAGFLLSEGKSVILVDTGHKHSTGIFFTELKKAGFLPQDLKLIVLTHTHFDHAGGAAEIQRLTGAPIAVHKLEAENLKKGRTPFPKGTRWKGKLIVQFGNIFARRMANYPPLNPNVIIDHGLDLHPYGIHGKVIHTPGHTAGSLSVLLENGKALVGDNVLGISLKEHYPPFANDKAGVLDAWERYIQLGVRELYPAHGKQVPIEALKDEIVHARKKYL